MTRPRPLPRGAAAVLLALALGAAACGGSRDALPAADDVSGAPSSSAHADTSATWARSAREMHVARGQRATLDCPPEGTAHTVWGTDLYTDDSSVCTAAVHAGRITLADGGRVAFEVRPGAEAYTGTTRNGVETLDYGAWDDSFAFVEP